MQAMKGDRDMRIALQRLRQLVALEQYAMIVDLHAVTAETTETLSTVNKALDVLISSCFLRDVRSSN